MKARTAIGCVTVLLALLGAAPGAVAAQFGFVPGSLSIEALNAAGEPDNRAGGHPDRFVISFALTVEGTGTAPRDLVVELPPGLVGNPLALGACPRELYDQISLDVCPVASRAGEATITASGFDGDLNHFVANVQPAPDLLGGFGINALAKVPIGLKLDSDGLGLTIEQSNLNQILAISGLKITLWGVPADHQNDPESPRKPLLTLPTVCGKPLGMTIRARSWLPGADWLSASAESEHPIVGCQNLAFEPRVGFDIENRRADSPSGVDVQLTVPQDEDPDGLAPSQVKSARIVLPEGLSISPSVVNGLTACSDAELALHSEVATSCPSSSKVGTVELSAPQLPAPLNGTVYVGAEKPGDRFRLFVVARGFGEELKLVGSMHPDPVTGRLVTDLEDLPQISFSKIDLHFAGGPRALLVTPLTCGPAVASARFEPYSGQAAVESSATANIESETGGQSCAQGPAFSPGFAAGSSPARAGAATSFSITLRRSDGEQSPGGFSLRFPPGLSARLGLVETCAPAAAAAGSCPLGSRIGSAIAELGSGPSPASVPGDVYLTGPYHGAPFGLVVSFRAVLGPFDLGTFTIRSALRMDSRSGQVSVVTDSLPQVIDGIPLRFRTIGLDIDRPGFLRNPTSCGPSSAVATIRSTTGAEAQVSSPFYLKGCSSLRFRPRLSMSLTGSSQLRQNGKPGLRIGLRNPPGSSNLRSADIAMPKLLGFDASGLRELCSHRDALEGECPAGSTVGWASGRSPLLDETLSGSIHVVQPVGAGLPELWTSIQGSGVRLEVRTEVSSDQGRVRTKLAGLPDIPLEAFTMHLAAGRHGILALNRDPCARRHTVTTVGLEGRNGAFRLKRVPLGHPPCESVARTRFRGGAHRG